MPSKGWLVSKSGQVRTLAEAIDEVDRELAVRRRCYDRWVTEGKLSGTEARDRYDRLEAALNFLKSGLDTVPEIG